MKKEKHINLTDFSDSFNNLIEKHINDLKSIYKSGLELQKSYKINNCSNLQRLYLFEIEEQLEEIKIFLIPLEMYIADDLSDIFELYKNTDLKSVETLLTETEQQIILLILKGVKQAQTINILDITQSTLSDHINRIEKKFKEFPELYKQITISQVHAGSGKIGFYSRLQYYLMDKKNIDFLKIISK